MIEGITSLGLISNSKFMVRLSDWMGGHGRMGGMAGLPTLDPSVTVCTRTFNLSIHMSAVTTASFWSKSFNVQSNYS